MRVLISIGVSESVEKLPKQKEKKDWKKPALIETYF